MLSVTLSPYEVGAWTVPGGGGIALLVVLSAPARWLAALLGVLPGMSVLMTRSANACGAGNVRLLHAIPRVANWRR